MKQNRTFVCTSNGSRNGRPVNLVCTAVDSDHRAEKSQHHGSNRTHSSSESRDCDCEIKEPVIYVRAPVVEGDDHIHRRCEGSRRDPYPNLQLAQANPNWNTLIVLYSPFPLEGGITLQDDQNLIGDPSGLQPVITNSTPGLNGGNGAVLLGDNCVKNIHFSNTFASAINYDNGKDVCIRDVLITGHNQGNVVSAYNLPIPTGTAIKVEVAGIEGHSNRSGRTTVENVIIRNNHTGPGINNFPYDGAHRKLFVKNSEIFEMNTTNVSPLINTRSIGISTGPFDYKSSSKVEIDNVYFHDFIPSPSTTGFGIIMQPMNGGKEFAEITHCRFDGLCPGNDGAVHIFATPRTDISNIPSGGNNNYNNLKEKSRLEFHVRECSFEEPIQFTSAPNAAVQTQPVNADTKWSVIKSTVNNLLDTFTSLLENDSKDEVVLIGNTAYGLEGFYAALTAARAIPSPVNQTRIVRAFLKDNNYTGGATSGAINVIPSVTGVNQPFTSLEIIAEDNCFDGQGSAGAGFFGLDLGTAGAGNAAIEAHHNNIVGYQFDVLDIVANLVYDLRKNYWGPGRKCNLNGTSSRSRSRSSQSSSNSTSDYSRDLCAPTQICKNGECVGPDVIVILGTGRADVSNPLDHPVKCSEWKLDDFDIKSGDSNSSFSPKSSDNCSSRSRSHPRSDSGLRSRSAPRAYQQLKHHSSVATLPDPSTVTQDEFDQALDDWLNDVQDRFRSRHHD